MRRKIMKKISLVLMISVLTIPAIQALSVAEYIDKSGPITGAEIDLSNQGLSSLNGLELIATPESVTALDLSNNKLVGITAEQLNIFPNLKRLDLSKNQLTVLPSLNLPKLKKLKIKNNNISEISNLNLPELIKFKASGNPIQTLSDLNLPKLKKLKMKDNKLTKISNINMPNIKKIKVGGNASELFVELEIEAKKIK